VDPAEQWTAYGVVTDDDRDGVADWRYGIDNTPVEPTMDGGETRTRWWRTNLHTGRTDAGPIDVPGSGDWLSAVFQSLIPPFGSDVLFRFGGVDETTSGPSPWGIELDMPFYAWSSVIANGRVVATDYAPDAGWLVATPGARPGGTFLLDDDFQLPLSMTIPDGWMGGRYGWTGQDEFGRTSVAQVTRELAVDEAGNVVGGGVSGVLFMILDDTSDACVGPTGTPTDARYGPGVDDLVTYLADQPKIDISENKDVTLDGYRAAYLEMDVRADPDTCPRLGYLPRGDEHYQVWILDVDGVRLMIDAYSPAASSESVRAELRQAVESIHFEQ
jgi:hypothetical protein